MENLSFTTFLKLCLLPSTQAKTSEIQKLVNGVGGYDFYKRLKLAAREVAQGKTDPQEILDQLNNITRQAEREHNISVATQFRDWWVSLGPNAAAYDDRPSSIFKRPGMPFGIKLAPEICYIENGKDKVTYLWATATPALTKQGAGMGIVMLNETLKKNRYSDHEFSIFDLRRNRILGSECVSNTTRTNLAGDLAQISAIWQQISG